MENRIGQDFENLTRRILYSYIAAYPKFIPANCSISVTSQKAMHGFMHDVLLHLYETPEAFQFESLLDDYYGDWELMNQRPELIKSMEKIENKMITLIMNLIKLGQSGEILDHIFIIPKSTMTVSKKLKETLELLGVVCEQSKEQTTLSVPKYPELFEAWKAYAKENNEKSQKVDQMISFIYGKYFGRVYTATEFFGDLFGDTQELERLEEYLKDKGFACINSLLNGKTRFACTKWTKDYGKDQKAYMSICFNWKNKNQLLIEFHLPSFREFLDNKFDVLDQPVKEFIFHRLKTCDGCGYCTQTDKTGKRPKLARILTCGDEKANKCPLYPNFTFRQFNSEDMKEMHVLMELVLE